MRRRAFTTVLSLLAVGACGNLASAGTIGYWRFGDAGSLTSDSGPNGFTLTPSATSPTQGTIAGAGPGSAFPSAIPQTGDTNTKYAQFTGASNTRFTVADNAAFTDLTFTAEAFFNGSDFGTNASNKSLVGHWNATGTQRSWLFAVGNANVLSFLYSTTGTDTVTLASGLGVTANVDYYAAVAVDMTDTSANGIRFYLRDLTNNGPLQTVGVAHTSTTLFNASTSLSIGSTAQPSSPFTGLIDEVRLSDTVLTQSQLLAVPEPASIGALMLATAGGLLRRRRRA